MNTQRQAVTAGEPAGIGPDLAVMLSQTAFSHELVIIADPALLAERADKLGIALQLSEVDFSQSPQPSAAGELRYLPVKLAAPVKAGQLNPDNADYVLKTLALAADGCLTQQFSSVITAPVHKGVINDAGIPFSGHTEFFAERAGVDKVVMMLATEQLRVALATTHLPLSAVSSAINQTDLLKVIQITAQAMQTQFGIDKPRIAVCGLNPHAGEGGHLGREEIDIIEPVIKAAAAQGIAVSGPWPADTIFVKSRLADFDVVLAMYHDQGLPVLKHQGFGDAVNITLGLPFIRTSVDHGTAVDLAGTGEAKVSSLLAAVNMAQSMAAQQKL